MDKHNIYEVMHFNYAFPVLGGLIADRYLGMKKAVTFGAILLVLTLQWQSGTPAIINNDLV